jgi:hypothetical protein
LTALRAILSFALVAPRVVSCELRH